MSEALEEPERESPYRSATELCYRLKLLCLQGLPVKNTAEWPVDLWMTEAECSLQAVELFRNGWKSNTEVQ